MSAGVGFTWAIADHPWIEDSQGAAVRVAMTVIQLEPASAICVEVDDHGNVVREILTPQLNADLTAHADVATSAGEALMSNAGLAFQGYKIVGDGFVLSGAEARRIMGLDTRNQNVVKRLVRGKDLTSRPRDVWVIDFGVLPEHDARSYAVPYDLIRTRVKPHRDANPRESMKRFWWQFGWPRPLLREAIGKLSRFIATSDTAKHRVFTFLDAGAAPDGSLTVIATADAYHLGILSSALHATWALAAGGRMGVGNDPVYSKSKSFDPYPFPDPSRHLRDQIGQVAETLDQHRQSALLRDERVTITGMYNVLEKLRSSTALTIKEREVHELAACGVLRDMHDELDRLVAEAYGWPWPMERNEILDRLVALHRDRVQEEKRRHVRWLRPDYQIPRFANSPAFQIASTLEGPSSSLGETGDEKLSWPAKSVDQLSAIFTLISSGSFSPREATALFENAKLELVHRHLETLAMVGEVRMDSDGRYQAVGIAA